MAYFDFMDVIGVAHTSLSNKTAPSVLTIGNFDGVHKGHQSLIKRVVEEARRMGISGGLITFDPHPLRILLPQRQIKNIFDMDERISVAESLGLDFFKVQPFSREVSELSPQSFLDSVLAEFDVRKLIVGHDFNFGKNRSGTLDFLKTLCEKKSIQLEILEPVKMNGEIVSSTKIREAITNGEVKKAAEFLARPFFLKGVIEKGDQRGRTIGFPTANLFSRAPLFPKKGVYVTLFEYGGQTFKSVTNVGQNPTFVDGGSLKVESHLLDFNKDIYGVQAKVHFLEFLRDEKKFKGVEELIENIKKDVEKARSYKWPTP